MYHRENARSSTSISVIVLFLIIFHRRRRLSKVLARNICQMLVLTKIKTVLSCSQMLAMTILYPSKESQQAMAILKAGKLEETTHGATTQKLITSLNIGGLWSITMPAQRIFVKIEKHFRLLTPNINLQGINLSGITRKAITDSDILSNFDLMVADASIESAGHVRKDVLYSIVKLYVRVRAFSVSKDVIQK